MDDIYAVLRLLFVLTLMIVLAWTVRASLLWLCTGGHNAPCDGGDIVHDKAIRRSGQS